MTWVRCRRCRTVGDRDAAPACFGCGEPFHEAIPAAAAPKVLREARRDLSAARIFTWLLGLAAGGGLLLIMRRPGRDLAVSVAIIDFFVIALFLIVVIGRGLHKAKLGCLVTSFLAIAGVAAAFFGAFLLVAAACSAGF